MGLITQRDLSHWHPWGHGVDPWALLGWPWPWVRMGWAMGERLADGCTARKVPSRGAQSAEKPGSSPTKNLGLWVLELTRCLSFPICMEGSGCSSTKKTGTEQGQCWDNWERPLVILAQRGTGTLACVPCPLAFPWLPRQGHGSLMSHILLLGR